jgi:hypothetical protein
LGEGAGGEVDKSWELGWGEVKSTWASGWGEVDKILRMVVCVEVWKFFRIFFVLSEIKIISL